MSLATLQEFLDRVDAAWLFQLTLPSKVSSPPTDQETATRNARVQVALDDASAELLGYEARMPVEQRPDAETKRVHCVKVALHLLTANRPGGEFKAIKEAYDQTIAFYTQVIDAAAAAGGNASPLDGSSESPEPVFTDDTLKGFV